MRVEKSSTGMIHITFSDDTTYVLNSKQALKLASWIENVIGEGGHTMARRRKLTREAKAFYGGIITALAVIHGHDEHTIYDEVIQTLDLDELVLHAAEENELEFSGLLDYGYARLVKCQKCGFTAAFADDGTWRCARCGAAIPEQQHT